VPASGSLPASGSKRVIVEATEDYGDSDGDSGPPVYLPERDRLGTLGDTHSWPVEVALQRVRERLFSLPRWGTPRGQGAPPKQAAAGGTRRSSRRRVIMLAGSSLLAVVTCASAWRSTPASGMGAPASGMGAPVRVDRASAGRVGAQQAQPQQAQPQQQQARELAPARINTTASAEATALSESLPAAGVGERAAVLERAIRAYRDGDRVQALTHFKQLALDPSDATARFMIRLITLQQQANEGQ
jgi:hypothetical protein